MNSLQKAALKNLQSALESKRADEMEFAIFDSFPAGINGDFIEVLTAILECDWHTRHEDVARALQDLKDPRSIDVLYKTAQRKFAYLEYNDSKALARKCIWALADIGTVAAHQKLQALAKLSDKEIAAYAQKRLDGWEKELARKGPGQKGVG